MLNEIVVIVGLSEAVIGLFEPLNSSRPHDLPSQDEPNDFVETLAFDWLVIVV